MTKNKLNRIIVNRIIEYLSYDNSFGILTRQAMDLKLKNKKSFNCCLIDFNNLKNLNQLLGYNKVNKIIYNIFNEFKRKDIICGRWFSGDEILIVNKKIKKVIPSLKNIAYKNGMSFKIRFFINKDYNYINKKIGNIKIIK